MAYDKKPSKKLYGGGTKKMYKKGSFLEPNKELTFGGVKKLEAAGRRPNSQSPVEAAAAARRGAENAAKRKAEEERLAKAKARNAGLPYSGSNMESKSTNPSNKAVSLDRAEAKRVAENEKAKINNKVTATTHVNTKSLLNTLGKSNKAVSLARPEPASGTYASAKKKNPNLDKLIKERQGLKKGTD